MSIKLFLGVTCFISLAGCAGGLPGPRMPVATRPAVGAEIDRLESSLAVDMPVRYTFKWSYLDEYGSASGPGAAVLIPPDTIRFDFRGQLGAGAGAALVVGERAIWAVPEEEVNKLVPNFPILWAMFGRARTPWSGVGAAEVAMEPGQSAWRFVDRGDSLEYIFTDGELRTLVADVRSQGERIGRVYTVLDEAGHPVTSRLDVTSKPARLKLEFDRVQSPFKYDSTLWESPDDPS